MGAVVLLWCGCYSYLVLCGHLAVPSGKKKSCSVEKRNPQCAINSDDNDLLTKQSSGLHIPPHCFLWVPMESWANTSVWDTHAGLKKCAIAWLRVCMCAHAYPNSSRRLHRAAQWHQPSVLTFGACLSAFTYLLSHFGVLNRYEAFVWITALTLCGCNQSKAAGLHNGDDWL